MTLLRPEFLMLLIVWIPALVWLNRTTRVSAWQNVIDPELFSALSGSTQAHKKVQNWLLPLTLMLITLALAGPALTQGEKQIASQGNLFVILDNSLSMAAADVSPDRSTRAKRMIFDWARSGLFDKTTVITYSASAHTVTPLTSDVNTLEVQLQALNPFIMPQFGNRAELAFEHAADMIAENGYPPPHLLWITDEIAQDKVQQIGQEIPEFLSATLVAAGTSAGSPIPLPNDQGNLLQNGNVVMVKTDTLTMSNTGTELGFQMTALGGQPSVNFFESIKSQTVKDTGTIDLGYWLLIPIILCWLMYSKKTSAGGVLAVCLMLAYPDPSYAAELFKNKEQQAFELLDSDPAQAFELTDSPLLASEALFRQGQFEQAASLLVAEQTVEAIYNRANALAHAGKLKKALALYDEVLKREDHEPSKKNKELIESFLENQPSESGDQSGQNQENEQNSDSEQGQNQQQDQQQDQQDSDSESDSAENASESKEEAQEQQAESQEGEEEPPEQNIEQSQQEARENQETEAILNQLNAPSGSILQNKFNLQYQKNPTETDGTLW